MIFRHLQSGDAVAYHSLRRRALAEAPQYVGPLGEREAAGSVEGLRERIAAYPREGINIFGGFADEACVAAAGLNRSLNPKYSHKLFLWGMYVLPENRGGAIGRRLLEHLLNVARGLSGVRFVNLQVTSTNDPATRLYESCGFIRYGIEPSALWLDGCRYDFSLMQRDLAQAPAE